MNFIFWSPLDKRECLNLTQAAVIAGTSESTLRNWCEEAGLGKRGAKDLFHSYRPLRHLRHLRRLSTGHTRTIRDGCRANSLWGGGRGTKEFFQSLKSSGKSRHGAPERNFVAWIGMLMPCTHLT
jgi:hypothetical protein